MLTEKNWMAKKLRPHFGHHIVCAIYGAVDDPADICVECEDCGEVLISAEDYNEPDCPEDCLWKKVRRYHKCTSCARNRDHPDNYVPEPKTPERRTS